MKNVKYLVLTIMLSLILSSASFPQMGNRAPRDNNNMREMMIEKLQLTPEQEKTITALRLQHQEKLVDLNAELKKSELQKAKLLSGDVVNRNDLLNNAKEIGQIKEKIAAERINHQMDVYDNLDANQRLIWKDMMLKGNWMQKGMKDGIRNNMRGKMMNRPQMQK